MNGQSAEAISSTVQYSTCRMRHGYNRIKIQTKPARSACASQVMFRSRRKRRAASCFLRRSSGEKSLFRTSLILIIVQLESKQTQRRTTQVHIQINHHESQHSRETPVHDIGRQFALSIVTSSWKFVIVGSCSRVPSFCSGCEEDQGGREQR